jgi:gluconate 5-dehydrogenase
VTYGFGGMCADFGPLGIQVNGLGPGYFATELTAALVADPSSPRGVERRVQPRAAAVASKSSVGAIVFLAKRASATVNGHIVYVRRCHDGRRPIRKCSAT